MSSVKFQELFFPWQDLTMAGTLHLPRSSGAHPGVLMVQGSGPTDRDSGGFFPALRDVFLGQGIAVYSFDKPGVGETTGDWRNYALADRASQSAAAVVAMTRHPEIDDVRVGVWGHSQGGWVAQILPGRVPELAFAICNSGPSIGVAEQDLYGCEHSMRAHGHEEGEIEKALAFVASLHAEARRGTAYALVEQRLLAAARAEPWYGYLTIDGETDWEFLTRVITEEYDPIEALRRIRCPYLAIYGGSDLLVPAWTSARESAAALVEAGNADSTIVVFPAADHRIQDPGTGAFATGYLDLVAGWAARRVVTAA